MQIQNGTVSVEHDSNRVIGDANADWSKLPNPLVQPVQFSLIGSALVYQVASLTAPTSSVSGFWELTVVGVIEEGTDAGLAYTLHKDFSRRGFPLISDGDVQTAAIMTRFAMAFDASPTDTTDINLVKESFVVTGTEEGQMEFFVPFAVPLPYVPQHIFQPTFVKGDPGEDNIFVVSIDTVGLSGFNVNLSAAAVLGQTLLFSYIKAPAANANLVTGTILIAGGLIGEQVIPVPISPALADPPVHVDLPVFEKVSPDDDNVFAMSVGEIAEDGFNVYLSAPAVAGQTMHYSYQKL